MNVSFLQEGSRFSPLALTSWRKERWKLLQSWGCSSHSSSCYIMCPLHGWNRSSWRLPGPCTLQSVMPQHFTTLVCQQHISFWMLWLELLSPMAEFLPHIAPIPCGNISLPAEQPFTGYCCTAGSGHTDWRKLHITGMMKNCWWDKKGRKLFQLNNTLLYSFHHTQLHSAYFLSPACHEEWKCLHLSVFTA